MCSRLREWSPKSCDNGNILPMLHDLNLSRQKLWCTTTFPLCQFWRCQLFACETCSAIRRSHRNGRLMTRPQRATVFHIKYRCPYAGLPFESFVFQAYVHKFHYPRSTISCSSVRPLPPWARPSLRHVSWIRRTGISHSCVSLSVIGSQPYIWL